MLHADSIMQFRLVSEMIINNTAIDGNFYIIIIIIIYPASLIRSLSLCPRHRGGQVRVTATVTGHLLQVIGSHHLQGGVGGDRRFDVFTWGSSLARLMRN